MQSMNYVLPALKHCSDVTENGDREVGAFHLRYLFRKILMTRWQDRMS